jgi:hypothetical protein
MHGPTPAELELLNEWIHDLRAFVHNEDNYHYGTSKDDDLKVMTAEGKIEVRKDCRWEELLQVMNIFVG